MSKTYARPQLIDRGNAVAQTLQDSPYVTFEVGTLIPTQNAGL